MSGLVLFAATEFSPGFFPYWHFALSAVGYGLMLPVIATLHERHVPVRRSGAMLGTIAGTSVAILGLVASTNAALLVATLFVAGVWWWTIGKMWAETGVLPRTYGWLTMGLAGVAFGLVVLAPPMGITITELFPALFLSPWLVVLGALLWRSARLP